VSFRCIDGTSGNQHYRGRAVYSADESVLSQSNIVLVENAASPRRWELGLPAAERERYA
jgi:hypothetical protein